MIIEAIIFGTLMSLCGMLWHFSNKLSNMKSIANIISNTYSYFKKTIDNIEDATNNIKSTYKLNENILSSTLPKSVKITQDLHILISRGEKMLAELENILANASALEQKVVALSQEIKLPDHHNLFNDELDNKSLNVCDLNDLIDEDLEFIPKISNQFKEKIKELR
jgi:hypothetical protein